MAGTDFKTTRQRLAKRRDSVTFAQQAGGLYFTATASRFDDGSLGEIFLHNHNADLTASNKSFETRELQLRWHFSSAALLQALRNELGTFAVMGRSASLRPKMRARLLKKR